MESYKSVFVRCQVSSELEKRIVRVLEGPKDEHVYGGNMYKVHGVESILSLCQDESKTIYFVIGESTPLVSSHPQPQQFAELIEFKNSEHDDGVELRQKSFLALIWAAYKSRLLARDRTALLEVAEVLGKTKTGFELSYRPRPLVTEDEVEAERLKYTSSATSFKMRPEWLAALHAPQMDIIDGTVYIYSWAMRTETRKFYEDISESIAFWKITATFSDSKIQPDETLSEHSIPNLEVDNGCKLRVRRLLHCYEEMVMRQRGTGDLNKNLNFKLFNTAMIHLAKRKFTGNEGGYTPSDERFRKFFIMLLKRENNMTPESIKFLLNNCCVNSLDLSNTHESHNDAKKEVCDCTKCVTAALGREHRITELDLAGMKMDGFNDCVPNPHITRLSINNCRHLTSLEFLNLFPNLEHLSMASSAAEAITRCDTSQPDTTNLVDAPRRPLVSPLSKASGDKTPCSVSPIENLTRLTHLDIQNTNYLARLNFNKLSQLKSVNINSSWIGSVVTLESFEHIISALPNLESINFSAGKIACVTALGELKHLREVELMDGTPTGLFALTSIVKLVQRGGSVSQKTFDELRHLTQLEELVILPFLPKGPNVRELVTRLPKLRVFIGQQENGTGLDFFSPNIEVLHFDTKEFDPNITRLTNLKSLVMMVKPSVDATATYTALAQLTQLESLEFAPMTNEGFGHLTTLVNLRELSIRQQERFDSDGAVHFKHLTALQRVSFYRTPLSDLGLAHLTKLEQLEYLSLKQTNVSKDAIEFLENHRAYLELDKKHLLDFSP